MRTISKSVIAAGLAATTVLSGLSFGSAAASASPVLASTPDASTTANPTTTGAMVGATGQEWWAGSVYLTRYASYAQALANAHQFIFEFVGNDRFLIHPGKVSEGCLGTSSSGGLIGNGGSYEESCNPATKAWKINKDGKLEDPNGYYPSSVVWSYNNYWWNASRSGQAAEMHLKLLSGTTRSIDAPARSARIGGFATPSSTVDVEVGTFHDTAQVGHDGTWEYSFPAGTLDFGDNRVSLEERREGAKTDESSLDIHLDGTELSASVTRVDHIARSAVISGTATKGADISVGSTSVAADTTTGAWTMTVDGLTPGKNTITVVQKVNNSEVDRKDLDVTIIEGGTLVPGTTPPVTLERGAETTVPFIVENNEDRRNMDGTVELTAPAGTTFAPGQTTVSARYRFGDSGTWQPYARLDLTDGVLGNDGTTLTFTLKSGATLAGEGEQYRYDLQVVTPADAAAGASSMDYVYAGTSSAGSYRAAGQTPTIVEAAEVPAIRDLEVTSPTANSTVSAPAGDSPQFPNAKVTFTGTGEPDAKIEIARHNGKAAGATVVQPDGTWTAFVDANWVNYPFFTVIQTAGEDVQTKRVENVTIVREGQSRDFAVTSVASGGTITAPAGTTPEFPNAKVPFAGDGQVGATVKVFRQNGALAGSTIVEPDGHWSLDTNFNWGKWDVKVTQTIGSDVPTEIVLTGVSIVKDGITKPFSVTSPQPNATVVAAEGNSPDFPHARLVVTGEGASGATVILTRQNGKTAGSGVVGPDGTYSFDADVNWGTWSFTATQTTLDNAKTPIALPNVTVVQDSVDLPFAVTAPTEGGTVTLPRDGAPGFENARVVFEGTGNAGDQIEVLRLHNGKTAGRGTVDNTGHWSVDADYNFGTWGAKILVNGDLQHTITSFTIIEAK